MVRTSKCRKLSFTGLFFQLKSDDRAVCMIHQIFTYAAIKEM